MCKYLFGRYAIVADKWISQSENLMAVRRVRQTLHIPHHTCLEYWEKLREGREREKEEKDRKISGGREREASTF